jgi:serine/threonine protein kinase
MSRTPAPHTPTERIEIVGRYALHGEIASGGMAVVHFGRLLGPVGFSRPVAIKRLHPQLARDPEVRGMFVDEARLASRIRHPNVVPTLDVVSQGDDLLLVMEYVHGEALNRLMRASRARAQPIPLPIVLAVMTSVLHGLHAAHEATNETGEPLHIVHRDVSPQNVMVGVDGAVRVLDFGIARAAMRAENTREGMVKGKIAYMAPEQLGGGLLDRRADVFAAAVVLWEMIAGRRLFVQDDGGQVLVEKLLRGPLEPPSLHARGVPKLLDAITLHGLARSPQQRFATAREMALALEKVGPIALLHEVGDWVEAVAAESVGERTARLKELETTSATWRATLDGSLTPASGALSGPSVRLADLFDDIDDEEVDGDGNSDPDHSIDVTFEPEPASRSGARTSSSATTRVYRSAMAPTTTPQAAIVPLPEAPRARAPHALLVFLVYALLGGAIVLAALNIRSLRAGDPARAEAPPPPASVIVTAPSFSIPPCPTGAPALSGEPARPVPSASAQRGCPVSTANDAR